ncbi:MAG: hypothetical protein PW786_03315 [Arachidicoccus sp.]|nr:hypothetical protein [Arachidicoccus sp.]
MKYLFMAFLMALLFSAANAQQINSYKYIIVPNKFSSFDENEYQLNGILAGMLENKHYVILPQDKSQWPQELRSNDCLVLTADIKKGKSLFKNKLQLIFKDCSVKEILTIEGSSSIKEYNEGYHDALNQAIEKIDDCKAEEATAVTPAQTKDTVKEFVAAPVTQSSTSGEKINKEAPTNTFTNGEISLTKSDLTDGSFLLIRAENSQVYAQFFPSSKAGIYHVKMINPKNGDYYTIGYFAGNTLSIEIQNVANKWNVTVFKQ